MKARNGRLCMHATASGVYLKAAGNQNEVSCGLLHVQICLVEGSLQCFKEN